jgi:hypothetical protein
MGKRRSRARHNSRSYNVAEVLSDIATETATVEAVKQELRREYDLREKELKQHYDEELEKVSDKAFMMMLYFPVEVLLQSYWPHARKNKIQSFIDQVITLYTAYNDGDVDIDELKKHIVDTCGVTVETTNSTL